MRPLPIVFLVLSSLGCQSGQEPANSVEPAADRSDVTYGVVHGWPVLPEGRSLGQATGVGVDSHDHVFVFHRAGREWSDPLPVDPIPHSTIAMFDGESGELLAEWGENLFAMPHGLTVDDQDNIWVTDVGLHQVVELTHDGHPLLTVGTGVMGNDENHFALPTDVAVLPDGSFYVSDGYGNTRVVKYSATGEFLFQWGAPGSGPGEFDLPHGIALDREGRVYVADRSNSRVQIFDARGRFLDEWKRDVLGRPYAVAIGVDGKAYVIDGGDQPALPQDRSQAFRLSPDGRVEARFGRYGSDDGQFLLGHDIAVADDGAVYVADAWGLRVQKFLPE